MKQKILLTISLGLMIAIFSGCASTTMGVYPNEKYIKIPNSNDKVEINLIGTYTSGMPSISRARDAEKSALLTFQMAAQYTLFKKDRYFAVYKPEMISNFNGSPINTIDKFLKKCSSSVLGSIGSSFDDTGINTYACRVATQNRQKNGFLYIAIFNKKPKSLLVWDAKKVVYYLKKYNMYTEKNKIVIENLNGLNEHGVIIDALPYWRINDMDKKE